MKIVAWLGMVVLAATSIMAPAVRAQGGTQRLYLPLLATPDTAQIAYTHYNYEDSSWATIHVVHGDGSRDQTIINKKPAEQPSWSPDGTRITFVCPDIAYSTSEAPQSLCLANADGSNQVKLAVSTALTTTSSPAWSPDGSRIAFSASTQGFYGKFNIYVVNINGKKLTQLTRDGYNDWPTWSPDSKYIAFTSNRAGTANIYRMRADGTEQRALTTSTTGEFYMPAWSPDGTRIAFVQRSSDKTTALMVMRADGTNQQQLTFPLPDHGHFDPAWSPDSKRLVYAGEFPFTIFVINADGTNPHPLVEGGYPAWRPVPSK